MPIANQPEDFNMCDAGNDGIEVFNLSIMDDAILNGESNAMFTVSYYESQQDADLNNNPFIGSYYISSVASETIFVRLENNLNTNCFSTTQFSIIINEQPVLNMEDTWSICKGEDSIELEADEGYDNYLWSTGETTRIITVLNPGAYTITASNTYQNFICDVTKTINVAESNVATITNIETIDWSQNNNAILVEVGGGGDYEYSLDGLTYQDSNQFNNLIIDDYTVYVRDKNGCGVTTKDVYLLFYPNYFTPNGDTFHDTWQIYNGDKEPNSEIYIFDRYGKLLTQIKTSGLGWDGIVNGKLMPTSDYWFLLKRQNGKEYRGHFTLRR
jgi:gliding motility-associated-like protein